MYDSRFLFKNCTYNLEHTFDSMVINVKIFLIFFYNIGNTMVLMPHNIM